MSLDSVLYAVYLALWLAAGLGLHEFAHAWTALRLGDPTPKQYGRLTLNPRAHVDPFGTLVLPGILLLPVLFGRLLFPVFAYARPQPLNPWSLRRQDRHTTLVALAGPAANVVLAFVVGALFRATGEVGGQLALVLAAGLQVNVTLAILNLVPVPGLDGSRVLARFLSPRAREVYTGLEQYLALFILLIFFILPGPIFAFVEIVGNGICGLVAGTACLP
ncbi:MAG TPA: site-2 protease family protein [Actinomycetota bacterium]|nr:site-2 protease family protein [Actinomycetota bacterium]